MKRILLTSLLFIVFLGNLFAEEVTFVASAPKSVVLNQHFRLSYTVNTSNAKEPQLPNLDGFKILSGPNISTMSGMQMINGKTTSSAQVTFTYIIVATKEGKVTIPGAKIDVEGKELTSNSVTINILPEEQASASSGSSGRSQYQQSQPSTNISDNDLFMRATISKSNVYEQEALLLTYKVYSAVNLRNLSFPTPELKGFNIQEVDLPKEKEFEPEHYNGRNYNTIVWRQFVLFPQQTGELVIPSLEFEALVAVQRRRNMDPFEMLFNNGFGGYVEVNKILKTKPLKVNVERLPAGKPSDFSGGVGEFSIASSISTNEVKTNNEFTLKVTLKGTGNMKLMGNPVVELPTEFEAYEPVIENKYSLRSNGFKGEKVYEYLVTPKAHGTYTIPAVKYTFFNTSTKQYETISSQPHTIVVEKGDESVVTTNVGVQISKERNKILATDIRHIKFDNDNPEKVGEYLFASTLYLMLYIVPLLLFALFMIVYRKKVAENANVSLVRTKKANKVAVKRLKTANKLMKENKINEFYDEILKAMWGYTSDKLNIPVSELTKENIANKLLQRGVDSDVIGQFHKVLDECEFARYAPGDKVAAMDNVYSITMSIISKMENSIK